MNTTFTEKLIFGTPAQKTAVHTLLTHYIEIDENITFDVCNPTDTNVYLTIVNATGNHRTEYTIAPDGDYINSSFL